MAATRTRTPGEHYEIADRILTELDELKYHEFGFPAAKAKLALASVHARLAQCTSPEFTETVTR